MNILDRILLLLGDGDQKALTDYLGLKKTAFTDWKGGKSHSYRKYLVEIAEYFNVSIDYLVYGKKNSDQLSDMQKHLLSCFEKLNHDEQIKVVERAETLAELAVERAAKQANKAEETAPSSADPRSVRRKPLPFPTEPEQNEEDNCYIDICSFPANAGTGVYFEDIGIKPLQIVHTDIADRANYAIRVSGDSMMPEYCDGDIVLVETCRSIKIGEIGVFMVDGDAYIKKYGGDRLISLNPKYKDMLLKKYESSFCRGRVLGIAKVVE